MKSEVKMWFIIILVIPIYVMRDVEKIERITVLIPKQSTIKENDINFLFHICCFCDVQVM